MENPEKIEIEGLKTIHKLCKFGVEHNMEGCSFTEIVERMFVELVKAKADAVPEGFVLVPKESLKVALFWINEDIDPWQMGGDSFADLFEHKPILEKVLIEAAEKEMIEAQEQSHD